MPSAGISSGLVTNRNRRSVGELLAASAVSAAARAKYAVGAGPFGISTLSSCRRCTVAAIALSEHRCETRSMGDVREQTRTERLALIGLLEQLGPDEWATPSLCEGWTVRDVAAHLAYAPLITPLAGMLGLGRAGFRVNKLNHDLAVREARRDTEEILDQLRDNAETGAKPMGMPMEAGVADAVVHQLDIRRPLDRPRRISPEAFVTAADYFARTGFPGSMVVGGNVRQRHLGPPAGRGRRGMDPRQRARGARLVGGPHADARRPPGGPPRADRPRDGGAPSAPQAPGAVARVSCRPRRGLSCRPRLPAELDADAGTA